MAYIPHTEQDLLEILTSLGPQYLEQLRELIPDGLRLKTPLDIDRGKSEQEVRALLNDISKENTSLNEVSSFLGAGAYNHYVPSVVDHLAGLAGFYTSYTPYQSEISQGTLQAIFEYQTLICQLTSMEVSNASLYDGASATAEAVLMARRIKKQGSKKIFVSRALHPEYRETLQTYLAQSTDEIIELPFSTKTGETNFDALKESDPDDGSACVVVQSPNFFGIIEDINTATELIHSQGGLLIAVVTEPLSMALIKPPAELGADITVGEAQSFGNKLNFGGPHLGFMATKKALVRQMPGRVVGQTVDSNGKRSFCLTLTTREQHIRRDRATSNICTNQGLNAISAAIYMTSLGRKGLMNLALLNYSKSRYLKKRLLSRLAKAAFVPQTFNEFTLRVKNDFPLEPILAKLLDKGIIGGLDLSKFYPELNQHLLISTTELNTRADIDKYADTFKDILNDAFYQSMQEQEKRGPS